jgi:general secretion pathway protein D
VVPAAGQTSPAIGGPASAGTEVVSLRYTSAVDLVKVLGPVVGQGNGGPGVVGQPAARIIPDAAHNAILITGDSAARATIESLIKSFDIDALAGRSFALFPVPSTEEPRRVAAQLKEVFQTEGDGGLAGVVRIIPMDAADAVLVVAPEPRFIDDARRLFNLLDRTRETTARSWHVYYVQNGESADLANVLQQAFTPNNVTEHGSAKGSGGGNGATVPGQGLAQMTSGTGLTGNSSSGGATASTGNSAGSTTGGLASAGSATSTGGAGSTAATQSLSMTDTTGGDTGNETPDQIRIIANHVNNAILIYATPDEQSTIEAMLRKIDILPLQVRIDAAIAEVTLNDQLQYGTQFYLKSGGVNGLLSNAAGATSTNLSGSFPGFVLSAGKVGSAQLVLSALSDVTNVRILSSPQVMVLDNQPARLLVGNLVPYLKESSQSTVTSGAPIVSSIDYRETGVILDVVPRVNKGGLVTLDLSQEVSQVQSSTSVGGIESPTFTDRAVRSRIVVQDGQTVGLAGLISDDVSEGNSGLPFLKNIPVLGSLFSTQTNTRQRTELVVLITPHVIEDQRAARALTEEMRRNLLDAALVPQQLQVLPPSGSPNPNAHLTE